MTAVNASLASAQFVRALFGFAGVTSMQAQTPTPGATQTSRAWHTGLAGIVSAVLALQAAVLPCSAHAQSTPPADQWRFEITPYLWLPNVNGSLNYSIPSGGTASPEVNVGADSYLSDLKAALLISGVATKGRWAIGTDIMYLKFGSEQSQVKGVNFVSVGRDPVSSSVDAGTNSDLEALVWTVAGSYSLLQKHPGALDLVGGVRYFGLDTSTDWNLTTTVTGPGGSHVFPRSGSISERLDLWDGIVGLRGRIRLGESNWSVSYYGDIGAGTESSTTYQWLIGINYDWRWGGLVLAYRELQYDQSGDRLVQDLRFSGPALGIQFRF